MSIARCIILCHAVCNNNQWLSTTKLKGSLRIQSFLYPLLNTRLGMDWQLWWNHMRHFLQKAICSCPSSGRPQSQYWWTFLTCTGLLGLTMTEGKGYHSHKWSKSEVSSDSGRTWVGNNILSDLIIMILVYKLFNTFCLPVALWIIA